MVVRPRILVSNDDGIHAPGLRALAAALHREDFCDLLVCGPSGERSGQSHAITLGAPLVSFPIDVEGAVEAYAVTGTPADSVMLAVNSQLFLDPRIDLVVSGINRGDNCGLQVIYSGTCGAAREAACKGLPAFAISLDSHRANSQADFEPAAAYCIQLIKAMLGMFPSTRDAPSELAGFVVNVNVPMHQSGGIHGFHLTHQGMACVFPRFVEITTADGDLLGVCEANEPGQRRFQNLAGKWRMDDTLGSDTWAVKNNWVSVSVLSLLSDIPFGKVPTSHERNGKGAAVVEAVGTVIESAAAALGVQVGGI